MQIKPMDTAGEDHTPLSRDLAAKDVDFFAKNHGRIITVQLRKYLCAELSAKQRYHQSLLYSVFLLDIFINRSSRSKEKNVQIRRYNHRLDDQWRKKKYYAKNHQHKIVFNCDGLINRDQSVKIKTIMITFADQPCRL